MILGFADKKPKPIPDTVADEDPSSEITVSKAANEFFTCSSALWFNPAIL